MPDGYGLTQDHYGALAANDAAIKEMERCGKAAAGLEGAYNVALAKAMLRLEDEGCKATALERRAKGEEDVATALVAWKCAEVTYATAKEHVQLTKRRADAIKEQIAREWTQAGGRP